MILKSPKYDTAIVAWAVLLGRFLIEPRLHIPTLTGSYEAVAHILIGWLLGIWFVTRDSFYIWWFWALTLVEIAMFIFQKAEIK